MDRAERTGLGVAVAGHVLLFGALSLTLPDAPSPPAPPLAVEVEFVDGAEVALTAEAAPAAATAPELAPTPVEPAEPQPEQIAAPAPEPLPAPPPPVAQPQPAPAPQPPVVERTRPQPQADPRPAKPQAKAARPSQKAAPKAAAAPASRLGADFLKGIGSDPAPAKASGATLTAASLAGIQQVIANRIQPCANRQISPGPGANTIRTTLRLRLREDGSLAATPAVVSQAGKTDENERFADRVADLAVAAVRQCAPLRGLPAALYKTPKGGWSDIRFSYKLPG